VCAAPRELLLCTRSWAGRPNVSLRVKQRRRALLQDSGAESGKRPQRRAVFFALSSAVSVAFEVLDRLLPILNLKLGGSRINNQYY
jgi:hypothetical protein